MFKLVSEDRQRKSAVLQIVRKSVPSVTLYGCGINAKIPKSIISVFP